ncbi:MAG: LysR family transcriptional regulator [Desulfobacterium sp.]|nr:LysR family transcriptional regulator [Desulfobacterium sp.]
MDKKSERFSIRSKIWIEDEDGNVVFGLGRLKIFEAVHRLGSLQAAAKELKMSYRALWGRVKATEERLGFPLLVRSKGGTAGGGSELMPLAMEFVEQFRQLHKNVVVDSDQLFEKGIDIASTTDGDLNKASHKK